MAKLLIQGVSKTVREIRNLQNCSQEELAFKSGLDRTYISGVERGTRNISLESLESIINGLEIEIPEFLVKLQKNIPGPVETQE
jgi:transcriptional regulator with XRE-family HTH domain